jgi:hypothetical protein
MVPGIADLIALRTDDATGSDASTRGTQTSQGDAVRPVRRLMKEAVSG